VNIETLPIAGVAAWACVEALKPAVRTMLPVRGIRQTVSRTLVLAVSVGLVYLMPMAPEVVQGLATGGMAGVLYEAQRRLRRGAGLRRQVRPTPVVECDGCGGDCVAR